MELSDSNAALYGAQWITVSCYGVQHVWGTMDYIHTTYHAMVYSIYGVQWITYTLHNMLWCTALTLAVVT